MQRKSSGLPEQIRKRARGRGRVRVRGADFISTGSILLNLAASQRGRGGGWARGHIGNLVGDGSTGKTLLALEAAAAFFHKPETEPANFPPVETLQIVYNNVEGVMDFPLEQMYGSEFVDAVEWVRSDTIESFGRDLHKRVMDLQKGEAMLYVADSLDAMVSEVGKERAEKKAEGKKVDGSYGTEKAKYLSSEFFNNLCGMMGGKDATILLVSQVRENLNAGPFSKKHYRAGGKALDFYTHQVAWLYQVGKMDKTFRDRKRVYGVKIKVSFERNKVAKPFRQVEVPILFDYGVDDVSGICAYLGMDPKKTKAVVADIEAGEMDFETLAAQVEDEWQEEELAITPTRRRKYT